MYNSTICMSSLTAARHSTSPAGHLWISHLEHQTSRLNESDSFLAQVTEKGHAIIAMALAVL